VLVSSHLLNEVEQLIDQVVIISQGVTRYYGSLDQLRKGQQSRVLVQPADAGALVKALQENGIQQVSPTPDGRVAVAGSSVQQIGDLAAKAGIAVYGMQEEHADLERMFFQLTQGQYAGGPGFPPQQPQYQGPPPGYQGPPSGPQQYQQGPPTGGQYQQGPPSGPQQQQQYWGGPQQ
jgi:ABC-2 type transport system ATP-binding protein